MALEHYVLLADVFVYPDVDTPRLIQQTYKSLETNYPDAAKLLERFIALLPTAQPNFTPPQLRQMQEIYIRTFDVQSVTPLEIGYVLFGDDYKRGEVLVNLRREHKNAGIECGSELADYLPSVLRLISVWEDRELCLEFVQQMLYPALTKMVHEFDAIRMAEKDQIYKKHYKTVIESSPDRACMYQYCLEALRDVLKRDFSVDENVLPEHTSDFLRSIKNEMDIADENVEHRQPELSFKRHTESSFKRHPEGVARRIPTCHDGILRCAQDDGSERI